MTDNRYRIPPRRPDALEWFIFVVSIAAVFAVSCLVVMMALDALELIDRGELGAAQAHFLGVAMGCFVDSVGLGHVVIQARDLFDRYERGV